jgi:hypothetical protein
MKLSRRGKRVIRTRHGRRYTKRVGKHLRYRGKKVRASKLYHRGNKRTYKRGRRFQRGGFVMIWNIQPGTNKIIGQSFTSEDNAVIDDELNKGIFDLKYKKEKKSNFAISKFTMHVFLTTDKELEKIQFFRFNVFGNSDIFFSITDIRMLTEPTLLQVWKSNAGSTYDFNYSSNTETLKKCSDLITNAIRKVPTNATY